MEKLKKKYIKNFHLYRNELDNFAEQKKAIRRLWNISQDTAMFIYFELLISNSKNILEIGTSNGYSTFWLSLAAAEKNGVVHSIEFDDYRFSLAKENLKNRDNVEIFHGRAENIIPNLEDNFYDAIFIDANKSDYFSYINLLNDKMKNNCLIIADNVISHSETTNSYLRYVKNSPKFISTTLSIGAGLEMTYFFKEVK